MIHLKCAVVHYANLNSSSISKAYLWAVEYAFFFLIPYLCFFNESFVKNFMNHHFLIQNSKIHFKMKYLTEY